jgi:hypothetical protein
MFEIGEKIICRNASMQPHTVEELNKDVPNWVKQGEKYTVRGFTSNDGIVDGVWLEEIVNQPVFFRLLGRAQEPSFAFWRFEKTKADEVKVEEFVELNTL